MKFEEFLFKNFYVKSEIELAERIRSFLEKEAIDAEIIVSIRDRKIFIKPFTEIIIDKGDRNHLVKTEIKGELDKKYESLIEALFCYLIRKREYEIEGKIREFLKRKEETFLKLDFKEKNFLKENPLFQLFERYEKLSREYKEKYEENLRLKELITFTFFKIINAEKEEYLKEILFFTLSNLLKTDFDFFFFFFEGKEILPTEELFSSNFLDEFFLDDLYRKKIREKVSKAHYKGKNLYLYYSNLIEDEKGVFGLYTECDLVYNPEYKIFFEYLSILILYFYLKKRIKFSYSFTRKNLPLINLKGELIKIHPDPEIINTLIYPLEKLNIKDIVKEVFELLDFDISRKKIKIEMEEKDFWVEGDRVLLRIAFSNLFKHLISFNRIRGYMKVFFDRNSIIIEDTGIGLTGREISLFLDPQSFEDPLSISGIIFKTLNFELDVKVERGIGNMVKISV